MSLYLCLGIIYRYRVMLRIDAVIGAIVQRRNNLMWYLMLVAGMGFTARTEGISSRIPMYSVELEWRDCIHQLKTKSTHLDSYKINHDFFAP